MQLILEDKIVGKEKGFDQKLKCSMKLHFLKNCFYNEFMVILETCPWDK